jgi:hypothetical protein
MAIVGHALRKEIPFSFCVGLVANPKRGWVCLESQFAALLGEFYGNGRSRDRGTNSNNW